MKHKHIPAEVPLKEAEQTLQDCRDHLEEEVALRTEELAMANLSLQKEIIERLRVEADMQATIDRFQTLADRAPAFIAHVNARTLHYEFVNALFANAYGLPREKIIGNHMRVIIGEANYQFALDYIAGVLSGKTVFYENYFTTDYEKGWLHVNYSPVFDSEGQVASFIVLSWNITDQKLADEKIKSLLVEKEAILKEMEKLAITDPLTEAYNRRYFCEVGDREMERARRTGQALSIIMFDLDHFKQINDSAGHSIGDEVLKTVVARLHSILRENDTLGRLGGEEFYILLPNTTGEAAVLAAERFRALIENIDTVTAGNDSLHITASFGVSQIDTENSDFEAFLQQADHALYQAKAAGRNCVVRLQ